MKKPTGYDEAQAMGEFIPVDLGGHYAVVKQVAETTSSSGKEMIVVLFDFASQDKQAGYFTTVYNNDDRTDKKWPYNGSMYIMVNDYQDPSKTSRQFKTFCSCAEKSNSFKISWGGNNWAQQFRGKKVGVVFGEVENEYDGKVTMRRQPRWFCKWDAVNDAQIPQAKYLPENKQKASSSGRPSSEGFMNIPQDAEDDVIPF